MKIALYAHGGSANHGCEALVRSTIQVLGQDAHHYCVLSEKPAEDLQYGLDGFADIYPTQTPVPSKGLNSLLFKVRTKLGGDRVYYQYLYKNLINPCRDTNLALAIGGDNYCYQGFLERFSVQNDMWVRQRIPTALWGSSIDPERLSKSLVKDLQKYSFITARESVTYEALFSKGLSNTYLIPDTAFCLDAVEKPLPIGFQLHNTVGINISPLVIRQEREVGIIMQNLEELIDYILEKTNMSVALIPHVVWKGNDDRKPLSQLLHKYEANEKVIMLEDNNAIVLKGFIKRCRFLIAARTHASIAGYSTGVPTLVIGYSVKSKGIATDLFGTDNHYVVPIQSIMEKDTLKASFEWLQSQEDAIRMTFQHILPEYVQKIEEAKHLF